MPKSWQAGDCFGDEARNELRQVVDRLVSLMTVPLVQGTLRYAYKVGASSEDDRTAKNAVEGATYAAAVLPLVASCDASAAATIGDEMKSANFNAGKYPDFKEVKVAFEATYECLGIRCEQVHPELIRSSRAEAGHRPQPAPQPCIRHCITPVERAPLTGCDRR